MFRLPRRGLFAIWLLLLLPSPSQCGLSSDSNTTCWQLANVEDENRTSTSFDGITVYYASYSWCTKRHDCQNDGPPVSSDFILVLIGFALPAVIFSTVIPRRWHLDLPVQFFRGGPTLIHNISKLLLSVPAISVAATFDMIGWITCIMTFAGPMAFSGIQEMLLDFRVVRILKNCKMFSARERLEAIVALLCGNLDQHPDDPTARIHNALIPSELTEASIENIKARLITIMNSQTNFGATIGVPAVFFLLGFLYNAQQQSPVGAVSFGIFWMIIIIISILSGTLLAGNSPHTVSVLVVNNRVRNSTTRKVLLRDSYDSELYPVAMWDRGFNKYQWVKNTTLWSSSKGVQKCLFQETVEISGWSWAAITLVSWLIVETPCLLALSFDYLLPWPWYGVYSLLFTLYLIAQTWLILVALASAYLDVPFQTSWRPWGLLPKGTTPSMFLRSCTLIGMVLTGGAILLAALVTLFGSAFQFSDGFLTCFWASPVSSWLEPASKHQVMLHYEITSQSYQEYVDLLTVILYRSAAIFTCVVCFLGWWYHRALRVALRDIIEDIEL
jgi:hypothetical protein